MVAVAAVSKLALLLLELIGPAVGLTVAEGAEDKMTNPTSLPVVLWKDGWDETADSRLPPSQSSSRVVAQRKRRASVDGCHCENDHARANLQCIMIQRKSS